MRALFAKKPGAEASPLQHLDARTKLMVTLAAAVLTVACGGALSQLVLCAATLVYALFLKRPGLLAVLYGAMAVMMAVAALFGLLLEQWFPAMGGLTLKALFIPFLRGLSMMNVVMVLALTTRVEDLLATLERIRLPFCIFLPTAVMLRFIPTFTNDIKQVWETLKIRGWPVGPVMMTMRPLLCARLVLAPVLFRALKSSETLGVASELKGLGTTKRTMRMDGRTMTRADVVVLGVLTLTAVLTLLAEVFLKHIWAAPVAMP
ncbi:energy-coupling factor transporter transmembrane component T family protein [Sutterella sp.]|uniref:energy-coupling factor transporter transmembrane component T family protein n=1 Tax=Sutterella sp. TaxID=1981025 RepID=UPI003FD89416